jgi:hypothetical protein
MRPEASSVPEAVEAEGVSEDDRGLKLLVYEALSY